MASSEMRAALVPGLGGAVLLAALIAFPFVYAQPDYDYMMHVMITGFF